jgi:hypothetical protein
VSSLILPNITFIGSCTIIPKEYIQTFKNIVYEFLWKGKKDPVKRSVLSNDYLEGGLKMTNIDTYIKALQIKWILRLLENSNDNWKTLLFFLLMRCFSGSIFLLWLYIY